MENAKDKEKEKTSVMPVMNEGEEEESAKDESNNLNYRLHHIGGDDDPRQHDDEVSDIFVKVSR